MARTTTKGENTMNLNIKKLHPNAKLPTYGTDGAAAFDLYAAEVVGSEDYGTVVFKGNDVVVGTGLSFEIPQGHAMFIFSRSGMGFVHGVRLCNSVGVIDSDYRGEVMIKLVGDERYGPHIAVGQRVAQAVVLPVTRCTFAEVDQLTTTERGTGGFGSTGA